MFRIKFVFLKLAGHGQNRS